MQTLHNDWYPFLIPSVELDDLGISVSVILIHPRFLTIGQCVRGPLCPYIHDPLTVAICKNFLQKGSCPAGDFCDLSHDPSPERVPACLHFLRGNCSNPSCRYAHVRVNPSAQVCREFATLGYCKKELLAPSVMFMNVLTMLTAAFAAARNARCLMSTGLGRLDNNTPLMLL